MAERTESCFSSPWSSMDHSEVDPFASNPIPVDVDMNCSRRIRPGQLVFKGQDTPFSDPWATTRPLTPLDQNVPQWFQRRKLALVPENVNSPEESPCKVLEAPADTSMGCESRDSLAVQAPHHSGLKRARSNIDMADQFSRDALMFEQLNSCGQVMDELMKLPAMQTLLSRKRKADLSDELGMDDMRVSWKRRDVRTDSCHYDGSNLNRSNDLLTAADFGSWNFGFELHLTAGWC